MLHQEFNESFWDRAAYHVNSILIGAGEQWMNSPGCPLYCLDTHADNLRKTLLPYLQDSGAEEDADLLVKALDALEKYKDHSTEITKEVYDADFSIVTRSLNRIRNNVSALQERKITLQDWIDNGCERKAASYASMPLPQPILRNPL